MISQFFHQQQKKKQELQKQQEQTKKKIKGWRMMDHHPELSLGPSQFVAETANSSSESDINLCRKRKYCWEHSKNEPIIQSSIDLQLKDPLPLDWEQCLDLESGRMYYVNKNTLKKSWNYPREQKLDLELNISPLFSNVEESSKGSKRPNNSSNNMVAVACLKCHLLVMLSNSSPSCPNCKYVHSLSTTQQSPPPKVAAMKSLETLSLLH